MISHRSLFPAALAAALLLVAGCEPPRRVPLPAPFPQTRGGTPVPAKGIGLGMEFGDGLGGQELFRKEVLHPYLVAGIAERASFSLGAYGGLEDDDPGGTLLTGKLRLGAPLGNRTSSALHLSAGFIDRKDEDAQDEALTALDLALPTEWLAVGGGDAAFLSLYAGPRLVHEDFRDRLGPAGDYSELIPGALGGFHVSVGSFHLFGEGTMALLPETPYRSDASGGDAVFLPSVGAVAHFGSPFSWDR